MKNIKLFVCICMVSISIILVALVLNKIYTDKVVSMNVNIQHILKEHVEHSGATGAAIGFIDNGKIQYYVYGTKSNGVNDSITQNTIFEIGSITKVFTTLALMDMADEGLLSLDDPIDKYLPDIAIPEKDGLKITLRHLATHVSSLPRQPNNMQIENPANPYADYTIEQLYTCLSSCTLNKKPGEQYEYSNFGMGLLGHILELIERKPYEQIIKERILVKLGMHSSAVNLTSQLQAQLALGHNTAGKIVENWDLQALSGSGSLRSSLHDMTQFLAANMGLGTSSLYQSMKECHKEQHVDDIHTLGLGWHIIKLPHDSILCHDGGTGGYRSVIGFSNNSKRGVVVLSNSSDSVDHLGLHILDSEAFKLPDKKVPQVDAALLRKEYLQKFVGTFEYAKAVNQMNGFEIALCRGSLYAIFGQAYSMQLEPIAENSFKVLELPDGYAFNFDLDTAGNIIEVKLLEPGDVVNKAYPIG